MKETEYIGDGVGMGHNDMETVLRWGHLCELRNRCGLGVGMETSSIPV